MEVRRSFICSMSVSSIGPPENTSPQAVRDRRGRIDLNAQRDVLH